MTKQTKRSIKQLRVTILTLLVATFCIVVGSYFTAYYLEKGNQQEEQKNESVEGKKVLEVPAGSSSGSFTHVSQQQQHWPDVSATGVNGTKSYDDCVLVRVVGPEPLPQKFTETNTLRIPYRLCQSYVNSLERLLELDMIDAEDVLFIE